MLEPLKKTRLYEEIIKQLQELIRRGDLKPGDRLPTERELALQLNVSRTAIREALRSMEVMGFIKSRVGGGTYIRQVELHAPQQPFRFYHRIDYGFFVKWYQCSRGYNLHFYPFVSKLVCCLKHPTDVNMRPHHCNVSALPYNVCLAERHRIGGG